MKARKPFWAQLAQWLFGWSARPPAPGVGLDDVTFAVPPHIVRRGGEYYLRYRLAATDGTPLQLRMVLYSRPAGDKGYYFFSIPISHPEFGHLVERPLALDNLTGYARKDAVYWLNPDGSEVHLPIKEGIDGEGTDQAGSV